MAHTVYLSFGSNCSPELTYLKSAVDHLSVYIECCALSSIYKTAPVGDLDQNDFYNMCGCFLTQDGDPYKLLECIHQVEFELGRVRDPLRPKGPRVIDIDIVLFDDLVVESENLSIPHKSMFERNFVLIPLREICTEQVAVEYHIDEYIIMNKDQKVMKSGACLL